MIKLFTIFLTAIAVLSVLYGKVDGAEIGIGQKYLKDGSRPFLELKDDFKFYEYFGFELSTKIVRDVASNPSNASEDSYGNDSPERGDKPYYFEPSVELFADFKYFRVGHKIESYASNELWRTIDGIDFYVHRWFLVRWSEPKGIRHTRTSSNLRIKSDDIDFVMEFSKIDNFRYSLIPYQTFKKYEYNYGAILGDSDNYLDLRIGRLSIDEYHPVLRNLPVDEREHNTFIESGLSWIHDSKVGIKIDHRTFFDSNKASQSAITLTYNF